MNFNRYPFFTSDYQDYEFFREGPKGKIKKVIKFMKVQDNPVIYNLAFGDENPLTGIVSDAVTSDNKDRDMVLATVANTINSFCDHYGNHYIYVEGSTPSRTRLYQMSISRILEKINVDFDIYGLKGDAIEGFRLNVNYDAFLVKRKIK
jgi:hypothetical protein